MPDGVAVYGLGEKAGSLGKTGRAWTMWNTDAWAYGPATDPLYKSVPFFISARDGRFHGIFLDNPWRTTFDFGQQERNVLSFGAEGGELNYYVIAGPDPKDVIRRYTDLTGRMELPPKWALGYHQCRYSYFPESRMRQIASDFRRRRIPCDVIYFDIDYMDGYRCFTWHPEWFPDPKKLMGDLHDMGFHTVAIIDPGIKREPGYAVYDQGSELGAWLTKPDGQAYVGRVWPGPSVFPDFTSPKVRDWWSSLFPPFVAACGIDGIWNDMNEPADFAGPNHSVPLDLRHDNEGDPASHLACHNVYGMQMARATLEGLKRARPGERAFTITRATYAGGQRFGAAWTGDNISTWEHLRMSITMVLNLGASGLPFVGADIGGFVGGASPELYARWIQVGSLFPFSRTHTAWGNRDQEPWSFGPQVEDIARQALERRYAMMPYLYTLFEESARTGLPIMRPLWLEFPAHAPWYDDWVFMLGPDVYVVPIVYPDARDLTHWLPPGVWFEANTGLIHASGQPVKIAAELDSLPLFVRAGAIIPMQSPVQSTTHVPEEPLILDVWPFGESAGELYEDDGATNGYQRGDYRRTRFRCVAEAQSVELTMSAPEGSYVPSERSPLVRLHGLPSAIDRVTCTIGDAAQGTATGDANTVAGELTAGTTPPRRPGTYCHDADSGTWLVRMFPDSGKPQRVTVALARPRGGAGPGSGLIFDCADLGETVAHYDNMLPPSSGNGTIQLRIRGAWAPYIVLPRVRFSADSLSILKVRLSTEHTSRIDLRFATREDPSLSERELISFEATPDGQMHEYTVDLAQQSGGEWTGTVYWLRLDFGQGARAGERITLDRLAFERPHGSDHARPGDS
jgi:alpha-glucosidase